MPFLGIKQQYSHMLFKRMSHLLEYLRYQMHTNIIHITTAQN
jgi:hypothetical protein